MDSYSAPQSISGVSEAGTTINIDGVYKSEKVTIRVRYDEGSAVSDCLVYIIDSINKKLRFTDSNGEIVYYVKYGETYNVMGGTLSGYKTPSYPQQGNIVANQQSRTIELIYKPTKIGVFIEATNGNLYTISEWKSSYTPNSIAICNENHAFGLALEYVVNTRSDKDITGVSSMPRRFRMNNNIGAHIEKGDYFNLYSESFNPNTYNYSTGRISTEGISNMAKSYTSYNGFTGDPSMEAALTYKFPNNKTGYNMCYGEALMVRDNLPEVIEALNECGGDTLYPGDTGNMSIMTSNISSKDKLPLDIGTCLVIYEDDSWITAYSAKSAIEVRPAVEINALI